MNGLILPPLKKSFYPYSYFPTAWQAVVFRNFGLVSAERLAIVLKTDVATVLDAAAKLGLRLSDDGKYDDLWLKRGYVTLIRQNWHLLTYEQLANLLNISIEKLSIILREDDFLSVKLGAFKPDIEEVVFMPLTKEQQDRTAKIKDIIKDLHFDGGARPFEFFEQNVAKTNSARAISSSDSLIIAHSYSALFGDCLADASIDSFPESLLEKYQDCGVNALWMHSVLYQLAENAFYPEISKGYKKRLENLKALVKKLKNYGIKLFLYFNEPRALPEAVFEKFPDIKGQDCFDGNFCLCTSTKPVQEYLKNSIKNLFTAVPNLGGLFTITASENRTNCYSHTSLGKPCSRCAKRKIEDVISEVNNIAIGAMKDAAPQAQAIVWNWGWDEETSKAIIPLLDKRAQFMCVSEGLMELNIQGVKSTLLDYSISNIGPSKVSERLLKLAKDEGLQTVAKVQFNNSWECSVIPYIPVFHTIYQHITNLKLLGINDFMISWSLGGYPSITQKMFKNYMAGSNESIEQIFEKQFAKNAETMLMASKVMSEGFKNFPFCLDTIYHGSQNIGVANPLFITNTKLYSTMVGFPFDDVNSWKGIYTSEQLRIGYEGCEKAFKDGYKILCGIKNPTADILEIMDMAQALCIHFGSAERQTRFIIYRENNELKDSEDVCKLLSDEVEAVLKMAQLMSRNAAFGFEATNHYVYNENILKEKLINIFDIKQKLKIKS